MYLTRKQEAWLRWVAEWRASIGEVLISGRDGSGEGIQCVCLWTRQPCGLRRCIEVIFTGHEVDVYVHPIDPF